MKTMKKWNYVISAVMAVLGIAIIAASSSFKTFLSSGDPGPGFWPMLLGGIIVLCSILLIITNMVSSKTEEKKEVVFWSPAHGRVYKMMGAALLFCMTMYLLGFYIAMLIFMPISMKLMGMDDDRIMVGITIGTLVIIFVAFQIGLKTAMPAPIFWR